MTSGFAALIDNPSSFRGAYPVERVRPIIASGGFETRVYTRSPSVPTADTIRRALDDGAALVIGAGGDGTLRDVAAALAGSKVPLGVLPGGTANVFAREAGIPSDPEGAARTLMAGSPRPLDLGQLSVGGSKGATFLLFAGAGLDAAALHSTNPSLKRRLGPAAIALGGAIAVAGHQPRLVRVVNATGAEVFHGPIWQLLAMNTALYAGTMRPIPGARPDDGLLDLCLLPAGSPLALGRLGVNLAINQVPGSGDVLAARSRAFKITFEDGPLPHLEIDGSPVRKQSGSTLRLAVKPGAVLVRLPVGAFAPNLRA